MKDKIKVLFICHGNICRSPLAEFLFRDMAAKAGVGDRFYIASAATHKDQLGNPPHPAIVRILEDAGIEIGNKKAVLLTKHDYKNFDYLIGMDHYNLKYIRRIVGKDTEGKVSLLLDYTDHPGDVADPWFTHKFNRSYEDIKKGTAGLLRYFKENGLI